jgi:hypothetical protein
MYTYEITEDFIVKVYDPSGNLIDWPGPWQSEEGARSWAEDAIKNLNNGINIYEKKDD